MVGIGLWNDGMIGGICGDGGQCGCGCRGTRITFISKNLIPP